MNTIVLFILLFLGAQALLTLAQFLLRKKQIKPVLRAVLIAAKALCAVAFAALVLAGPVVLRPVQPFLMAAYAVLLADAAADLLYSVICAACKKKRNFAAAKAISLVCGVLFFTYGVLNMQIVRPLEHTYESEKLTREHTIVFAADLHVGSPQSFETTKKTIEEMIALHPQCIILGGDIADDYTTKEELQATFTLFKGCAIPVYFIYGNHDLQGHAEYARGLQYTREEFEQTLRENDVTVLDDAFVRLSDDLLICGRTDISMAEDRMDPILIENPAPEAFLVTVDHQPTEFVKKNLTFGTDLQLSGHTHAGQLFPLRWLYALIGGYVYGEYEAENGAKLLVSAGAAGWRMPIRTDAHCNYEVIRLLPKQPEAAN